MSITRRGLLKIYVVIWGYFLLFTRIDIEELVAASDFVTYYDAYQNMKFDGAFDRFGTEYAILLYYGSLNFFLGELDLKGFLMIHFLLSYLIAATALYRVSHGPVMLLILLAFLDLFLANHLARQFISSAFVILALDEFCKIRRYRVISILLVAAYFFHSTAPIFFILGAVFCYFRSSWLRILLLICSALGAAGTAIQYLDLLQYTLGLPIVGKAFVTIQIYQEQGASSVRLQAMIGAAVFVLLPPIRWYEKVAAGFLAAALLVYAVPVLNARIGLIGSSILIGVPYWMLCKRFLSVLFHSSRTQ